MQTDDTVRLEVNQQALFKLLQQQRLSISDFRCLDNLSKQQVKSLWLKCLSFSLQQG